MKLIASILPAIAAILILPASASEGTLAGPIIGFVKHGTSARPVLGVPGASFYGPAIDLGELEAAAVCSEEGFGVGLTPERTSVTLFELRSGNKNSPIDLGVPFEEIRVSPGCKAVALLRTSEIVIFTDLPRSPRKLAVLQRPGLMTSFALADDGTTAIAMDNRLIVQSHDGQWQFAANNVLDVAFRRHSRDLVYTDANSVTLLHADTLTTLAGTADGLSGPRKAMIAGDGRTVSFVNGPANEFTLTIFRDGITQQAALPCPPADITEINDSLLGLQCENSTRIHLVELTNGRSRVLFIPEPGQ
jgi:hypothetical protein